MAAKPFLSRFSFSASSSPVLPLHTTDMRPRPGEYDLDELSPQPDGSLLFSAADPEPAFISGPQPTSRPRNTSVAFAYRDQASSSSRAPSRRPRSDYEDPPSSPPATSSRMRPPVLFSGPPPPIATSMLMHRDEEDRGSSTLEHGGRSRGDNLGASSIRLPTNTVLLDPRQAPSSQRSNKIGPLGGDSTWANLQRRERALQKDIQTYLDVQSAGLSAGLGRGPLNPSPGREQSSDGGSRSNTPTADSISYTTSGAASGMGRSLRLPTDRATATGTVIPVRQPKPRKLGLRAARAGLSRSISLLADLKSEEDESLVAALQARKRALAHLRRLAGRRSDIARELQTLEDDQEEPLTRELSTLRSAHTTTIQQITELEGQLAMLRQRQRTLEGRMEDVMSQRESGLSGYRGALKEVESKLTVVLRRPPIQPLDVDALGGALSRRDIREEGSIRLDDHDESNGNDGVEDASAGLEFLRLLPERRTVEMAQYWWDTEIRILERRRKDVGAEREALEEGGSVWLEAVQLVSDFEADLRKEMTVGNQRNGSNVEDEDDAHSDTAKGKGRAPTPEDMMRAQLVKMSAVIAGLQSRLRTAENKGWNLLICAIGAELEAFREARAMLRQALRAAGLEVEDDTDDDDGDLESNSKEGEKELDRAADSPSLSNSLLIDGLSKTTPGLGLVIDDFEDSSATPRLARSTSDALLSVDNDYKYNGGIGNSIKKGSFRQGIHEGSAASESDDNDVPPELLVMHKEHEEHEKHEDASSNGSHQGRHHDKDDISENEVPLEFLSEE